MKIYTVVASKNCHVCDGYAVIKSFINKEDAQHFVSECVKYDRTKYIAVNNKSADSGKAWAISHPAGFDHCFSEYDIEEHELVGGDE